MVKSNNKNLHRNKYYLSIFIFFPPSFTHQEVCLQFILDKINEKPENHIYQFYDHEQY